jgi:hypothetical protein
VRRRQRGFRRCAIRPDLAWPLPVGCRPIRARVAAAWSSALPAERSAASVSRHSIFGCGGMHLASQADQLQQAAAAREHAFGRRNSKAASRSSRVAGDRRQCRPLGRQAPSGRSRGAAGRQQQVCGGVPFGPGGRWPRRACCPRSGRPARDTGPRAPATRRRGRAGDPCGVKRGAHSAANARTAGLKSMPINRARSARAGHRLGPARRSPGRPEPRPVHRPGT